jgi:hypothetical protein
MLLGSIQLVDKAFAGFQQPAFYIVEVCVDQAVVAFGPTATDYHCFNIGDAGVQCGGDRIVRRPEIQGSRIDDDHVGLHARLYSAEPAG